jgi:cobaltochelatase CobT
VGEWCDASLDVAKHIVDKVKAMVPPEDEKKSKKGERAGEGGDEGDDGDDDGGGDGDDGDDDGGGDEVDGDDDTPASKAKRGPDEEPDGVDMLAGLRSGVEDYVIHDARAHGRYIPHPKAHALDEVREAEGALSTYKDALAEVMPQVRALRQKQRALVSSYARRRIRPGLDRGDIDDTTVADVRLGSTDVFSELTRKRLLNTAICGLVDCSGSMGTNGYPGHGAYYALRTAVALAVSWSSLNIPNEWLGFTALDHIDPGIASSELDGPFFCRPPLWHLVFKAYDERLKDVRARFGGIVGHGSNVDGEAVLWAWRRLSVRREKRKILVVVLDGQPASSNGCGGSADERVMQTHLRDVIRAATKSGVEVIGIGAGTSLPRHYFNADTGAKFVYVHSIGTLAMDVYRVMSQRVTDFASGTL